MASYEALQRVVNGEVDGVTEQVSWAMTQAALAVENEDPQTTNHEQRIKWALRIRYQTLDVATPQVLSMVLENATIAAAVGGTDQAPTWGATDNDVQFQVNSLVDRLAALG